ncbi:11224_t:CDS:10 [Rhizophagus irregularis]|nr:11224_t:CDS:10 [Rhizophagus irregularis]
MKPIFKEEIKSNQVLLHPNSLINHQFPSNNDVLCISLNNFFQKFYLSCVLNDDLDKSVIALPKWLSLTCEHLDNVNVQLVDTSNGIPIVKKIFLTKIYGDVWIPSSKSLHSPYLQSSQRAKSYKLDWPDLILNHFDNQLVSENSLLSDFIMDQICIFRVERIQFSNDDSSEFISALHVQSSSLISKIDQRETEVDISSLFVPRKVPSIVGFENEIDSLYQIISGSFLNTEIHSKFGIQETRTALIIGPHGSGKKSLIQHICNKLSATLFMISLTTMMIKHDMFESIEEDDDKNPLRIMFTKAMLSAPSVIVIKDLDILAVDDQNYFDKWKMKVISMLVREIQDIYKIDQVFVVGFTCDKSKLPVELCKVEIFQHNLVLSIPSRKQREEILSLYLSKLNLSFSVNEAMNNSVMKDYITKLGLMTSGYVPNDLGKLCRLAVLQALSNVENINKNNKKVSVSDNMNNIIKDLTNLRINENNEIENVSENNKESILPQQKWNDIGGYEHIKKKIKQAVEWSIIKHETYKKLGAKPLSGILLYALVTESHMNVICIDGPKIYSKYLGDTEKIIRGLFKRARQIIPCIVFIDELDSIASKREWDCSNSSGVNERVLSTLLNEIDGIQELKQVIIIGCTNKLDQIDDALLRPGRFDQLIYIGLPNESERLNILQIMSKKVSFNNDVNLNELSKSTNLFTGADLENLIRESGLCALRENILSTKIYNRHIEIVLKNKIKNLK